MLHLDEDHLHRSVAALDYLVLSKSVINVNRSIDQQAKQLKNQSIKI